MSASSNNPARSRTSPRAIQASASEALSRARYDAVIAYLTSASDLRPDQMVERRWDGTIREGFPRVILRLQLE